MRDLPFVGVNHIEAHIYANWLDTEGRGARDEGLVPAAAEVQRPKPQDSLPAFPLVALVVSGGHTMLVLLEGHGRYRLLGQTRDDAAGEAFDKVARIMGLGFPGGPAIQQAAAGAPGGVTLPRAWLRDSYDFSFSGLKTAVLHMVQDRQSRESRVAPGGRRDEGRKTKDQSGIAKGADAATSASLPSSLAVGPSSGQPDRFTAQLAFAFQESVVDVLVTKAVDAARAHGASAILLAGGVAANARLREELARRSHVPVRVPPMSLCTDNAAMIAAAAHYRFADGRQSGWELDVQPNLRLA
jgi:N6-L-threonylcarbamoyladenine synthase